MPRRPDAGACPSSTSTPFPLLGGGCRPAQRGVDTIPRRWLSSCCQDLEVLPTGEVAVEPRLIDDRADPRKSLVAILRHGVAEEGHRAGVSVRQPEEDPDKGGLSGTIRPETSERTSTRHAQFHIVDGNVRTKVLGKPVRLDRPSITRSPVPDDRRSSRRTQYCSIVTAGRLCPNGFPRWQTCICGHRLCARLNF